MRDFSNELCATHYGENLKGSAGAKTLPLKNFKNYRKPEYAILSIFKPNINRIKLLKLLDPATVVHGVQRDIDEH